VEAPMALLVSSMGLLTVEVRAVGVDHSEVY
jgi:hypothetical protein